MRLLLEQKMYTRQIHRYCLILMLFLFGSQFSQISAATTVNTKPIVIAHRGASGHIPEHTIAAYTLAILQGADFIEPDLVITKDGVLIARHDNVLNLTTDIANRPEFYSRKTTKTIDGNTVSGWFSEDFTLEEIKTLRAIERIPKLRPHNTRFNGQFSIPTLVEVIQLIKAMEEFTGKTIGLYPETKHPSYFDSVDLNLEEPLLKLLHHDNFDADRQVFIQSFEINNLKKLKKMTSIPLIQLIWKNGQPFDQTHSKAGIYYKDMLTNKGLHAIAQYADGIAVEKSLILNNGKSSGLVKRAHNKDLLVHAYTFRAENAFLTKTLQSSTEADQLGNITQEIQLFLDVNVDGFFTDHPYLGVSARDNFLQQ